MRRKSHDDSILRILNHRNLTLHHTEENLQARAMVNVIKEHDENEGNCGRREDCMWSFSVTESKDLPCHRVLGMQFPWSAEESERCVGACPKLG